MTRRRPLIAKVSAEACDRQLACEGGGLAGLCGLYRLFGGLKVFAGLQGLREGDGRIEVVERGIRSGVGQAEVLIERQADGTGKGQLVFLPLIFGRDERLLLVLVVDLGAQNVETGAGSGVVRRGGLVKRDLGGSELGGDSLDAGLVSDTEQVGVADGEGDKVTGVFRIELRALKVVLGGQVVLERGNVYKVLGKISPEIGHLERANDGLEAGKLESEGGKVDLLHLVAGLGGNRGQERLELLEALAIGVLLRGGLQDEAEVLTQTALDGVVERQVDGRSGGLAGDQGAFKGVL